MRFIYNTKNTFNQEIFNLIKKNNENNKEYPPGCKLCIKVY